ncbi:SSI family serine proteinase inhibitor [Lentzea fradiae]|uniref:SSI family serine proteinase inhibitor n=1 Tax=Lentzea fradiae TaxID=200378 RepID=UPI0015A2A9B3|nr:SSI family serine proteinase inhibitor [Lentzea fradiae]
MLLSVLAFAGTAQAAPEHHRATVLVLSAQYSDVEDNAFKATVLTCGAGDQHPRGALACATLASAGTELEAMTPDGRACTFLYAPVRVSMFGIWRGVPVNEEHTYPNSCVMLAHTGALFDF